MSYQEYVDGVLKVWSDDETRLYHVYDENGVEIGDPRPFTPEENLVADVNAEKEALLAAQVALRNEVRLIITEVKIERDKLDAEFLDLATGQPASNTLINNAPAKYIKATKKSNERIMRALIDVAKLLSD